MNNIFMSNLSKKFNKYVSGFFIFCALIISASSVSAQPSSPAVLKEYWLMIKNDRDAEMRELFRTGFNPNRKNPDQQPALIYAAREDSWRAFDLLMGHPKIDINLGNQYNETPIMYTALLGDLARTKKLIELGARVSQPGWNALHYATIKSQVPVVKLLLSNGASVDELNPDGDTALILAVRTGNVEVIQALINAGSDPTSSNFKAQDAIDTAREKGNIPLAQALEKIARERRAKQSATQ
jgi:ankyrin repeat protein